VRVAPALVGLDVELPVQLSVPGGEVGQPVRRQRELEAKRRAGLEIVQVAGRDARRDLEVVVGLLDVASCTSSERGRPPSRTRTVPATPAPELEMCSLAAAGRNAALVMSRNATNGRIEKRHLGVVA
jgi:hypothetical protein